VVDAKSQHLLWIALRWAAAALHQAERARASLEPFLESRRNVIGAGTVRVTPEMERPAAIFWSDAHFFMIAVKHLEKVLGMLGPNAPRLDKASSNKAVELRNLVEHWWKADEGGGAWKGYREKHGQHAGPAWVQFEPGDPGDLRVGADPLSIVALAADIQRVENELIEIEAQT
jgi:hypothetical protein